MATGGPWRRDRRPGNPARWLRNRGLPDTWRPCRTTDPSLRSNRRRPHDRDRGLGRGRGRGRGHDRCRGDSGRRRPSCYPKTQKKPDKTKKQTPRRGVTATRGTDMDHSLYYIKKYFDFLFENRSM